jgi:DNA-binding beta-propeller fold protein YncE
MPTGVSFLHVLLIRSAVPKHLSHKSVNEFRVQYTILIRPLPLLFFTAIAVACLLPKTGLSQERPATGVYPLDCAAMKSGAAFVVDRELPGVWKWQDGKLSVFIQASKKFRTPLNAPRCIALDHEGKLLVGDTATRDIYRVSDDGKAEPITGGEIGIPMDIAVKTDGTIYVADLELRKLLRIPAGTNKVEQVADVNPRGVFVDHENKIWVVSQNAQQLLIVSDSGEVEAIVKKRTFNLPHNVVVNSKGEAFVSDNYEKTIWKVVRGGEPEKWVSGQPLDNPVGLSLVDDQVVITDPRAATVFRLSADKKLEPWILIKPVK